MKRMINFRVHVDYAQPGAWYGLPSKPDKGAYQREDFAGPLQRPQWGGRNYYHVAGHGWFMRLTSKGFAKVSAPELIEQLEAAE